MKKRGQVTIFLILGIVIISAAVLFYFIAGQSAKSKSAEAISKNPKPTDTDIVKGYAESCLKKAADDALFNRIGPKGGLLNPEGDANYNEPQLTPTATGIAPAYVLFDGKNVPLYLEAVCSQYCSCLSPRLNCLDGCRLPACIGNSDCTAGKVCQNPGTCEAQCAVSGAPPLSASSSGTCMEHRCTWSSKHYFPDGTLELDEISQKISNYIEPEFLNCFNGNNFKDAGIMIAAESASPAAETKINEEDITVSVNYHLTVKKGVSESKIDLFSARLPIRLKKLYEGSRQMAADVEAGIQGRDTPLDDKVDYTIKSSDCINKYDKNGRTNVLAKPTGTNNILAAQFSDFSTYDENYIRTYTFQFGVKGVNFIGKC